MNNVTIKEPMKPMKPMEPMKPMTPMEPTASWWDESLGSPDVAGSQGELQYAYFARPRRLLVRREGQVMTYDTGEHRVSGVAQSSDAAHPRFTSDQGVLNLINSSVSRL